MTFNVAPSHAMQMKNSYLNNCETSTTQLLWLIAAFAYNVRNSLKYNPLLPVVSSPDCWFMIFKKQVSFFNENVQMKYHKLLKQK